MAAAADARAAAASCPVAVAGSMSSFCPPVMGGGPPGAPPGAAWDQTWFPGLADFREQAELLAEAGADLIALEMIGEPGYGAAAVQAAKETGLPVWLGVSPARRPDGTLGALPDLGDGVPSRIWSPRSRHRTWPPSPSCTPARTRPWTLSASSAATSPGRSACTPRPASGRRRTGCSPA